jgi:hypothetical protein
VALGALLFATPALAHHRHHHWRVFSSHTRPDLGCGNGTVVVNVAYTVQNDLDTSVPIGGVQYDWANDTYKRHVVVVKTGTNTFCAVAWSHETFTTLAGHSPGGTGTIPAGIAGRLFGGYVTNQFHGTLLATSQSPTSGDLGTKNFACVASSDHNDATKSCPGTFDWFAQYFTAGSGADFALAKYLFVYHAKDHGTWVDKLSGGTIRTHGDIVATSTAALHVEAFVSSHHAAESDRDADHGKHCRH